MIEHIILGIMTGNLILFIFGMLFLIRLLLKVSKVQLNNTMIQKEIAKIELKKIEVLKGK